MKLSAPVLVALALSIAACGPEPDTMDLAEGSPSVGSSGDPEPTATSTDGGSDDGEQEGSSGSSGSSPAPECILPATGRPCLDVLDHFDLCDEHEVGSLDHDQCAIAVGRLFGSTHLAGSWAVRLVEEDCDLSNVSACGMVGQQCADLTSEVECALTEEDDVEACIEKIECSHTGGPSTCATLDEGVVRGLCETLVG